MNNLSENATKLLSAIKSAGAIWEDKAVDLLFPPIEYSKETAAQVWQREANLYGYSVIRPVHGVSTIFEMNVDKSYADVTMEAVRELKKCNLIKAKNHGYNNYSYVYIGTN